MFKRILVALDGSPASNAGLKVAIQLASDQRAALLGLHVIDDAAIALNFEGSYFPSSYVDTFYTSLRETGRKTLYVGDQLSRRIVGMTERESAPLLRFLCEHMVDPLFTYRQKWQKNDVIMWDNRSTMHLALADFPPGSHRYCVRTTILGSPSGHLYQA